MPTVKIANLYNFQTISQNINPFGTKQTFNKNQYNIITQRNLFKVEVEKKESSGNHQAENIEPEKLEATSLKLVLWGTVTGGSKVYAVIEDKKLRQQSLYEIGDFLWERGHVKVSASIYVEDISALRRVIFH